MSNMEIGLQWAMMFRGQGKCDMMDSDSDNCEGELVVVNE